MHTWFYIDNLSLVMLGLIALVALSIVPFSFRYMAGSRRKTRYFINLLGVLISVAVTVSADNLILLLVSWTLGNIFLTYLMRYNKAWSAAHQSAKLALMNFMLGSFLLLLAFCLLYISMGSMSIQVIIASPVNQNISFIPGFLIFLTAITQSALWPFHRWLTSSLNSPTPISALMHAGLVNGGGYLLVRFAPLYFHQSSLLTLIFGVGVVSAILGTLWMLMQSDIKRQLACSTMGQMGFMIAECGLGLFPAAISHLCWHGFFKAYLFLSSASITHEKRLNLNTKPSAEQFISALVCGLVGVAVFFMVCGHLLSWHNTSIFLVVLAVISGTQFSIPIIVSNNRWRFVVASISTSIMLGLYAFSLYVVDRLLAPISIWKPQPMHLLYWVGLFGFVAAWLGMVFYRDNEQSPFSKWKLKLYVAMLNASQPHPKTITCHRNDYKY